MSAKAPVGHLDFRAAPLNEIRAIDPSGRDIILPSMLYLSPDEWSAMKESLEFRSASHVKGAGIMVLPASTRGDVILSGRDAYGRPAVPVPVEDGRIEFLSVVRVGLMGHEPVDPNTGPKWPFEKFPIREPRPEPPYGGPPEPCVMGLEFRDGRLWPSCRSPDCDNCMPLAVTVGLYGWFACACRDWSL